MRRQTTFKVWGIGFTLFFVLLLMTLMSACGPQPSPTPTPTSSTTPSVTPSVSPSPPPSVLTPPAIETYSDNEFGINWVNSPYTNSPHPISSQDRTDKAQEAGATWDRWPIYWYWVNQPMRWGEGMANFRWAGDFNLPEDLTFDIDQAAGADGNQLKTLAILDGIPRYYDCAYPIPYSEEHPDGSGCYGADDRIEGLSLDAAAGSPINEANRWATYVYTTVAHLSQHGVNHFEIWNEAKRSAQAK